MQGIGRIFYEMVPGNQTAHHVENSGIARSNYDQKRLSARRNDRREDHNDIGLEFVCMKSGKRWIIRESGCREAVFSPLIFEESSVQNFGRSIFVE
jgi:hypothetical protein